ncbi:MAG: sulfide-dependent adenosine diphosphate thiazole synthase [bacterium]
MANNGNKKKIFPSVPEKDITRAIIREYAAELDGYVESDVLIVGAGPSGLVCARDLALAGFKVLICEQSCHLGGGFWMGGYLMNKTTLRAPAHKILQEINVPVKETQPGLYVADAVHACSALIAATCAAGAKIANLTLVRDLIVRESGRVEGAVVNWAPVYAMPKGLAHVDPVGFESKVVVDATGHDAAVLEMLQRRGIYKRPIPGNSVMWVDESENECVNRTREIYPGLWVIGLAVNAADGLPRMGPTFGAMLQSGRVGAQQIAQALRRSQNHKSKLLRKTTGSIV